MAYQGEAQKLRHNAVRIAGKWLEQVRCELPAAKTQSHPALLNSIPLFLENLAKVLNDESIPSPQSECAALGVEHGQNRADLSGYSLNQVIAEYRILRHLILETLLTEIQTNPDIVFIINEAIDIGLAEAGETFANRQLESDRRAAEHFIAAISHDLRNPIGSAKMAMDLLVSQYQGTAETAELKGVITRNLNQAEHLLQDLLDINYVHSGKKLPIDPKPMDLAGLVADVVADSRTFNRIAVRLDSPTEVKGTWCHHNLRRLVTNLLGNAIKYGDINSPIVMTIRQNLTATTLAIHNSGPAIPLGDQGKLFEPSVRLGSNELQGWGLGLAIVKAIAEAHSGVVSVSSMQNEGTTFTVTLPNDSSLVHTNPRQEQIASTNASELETRH